MNTLQPSYMPAATFYPAQFPIEAVPNCIKYAALDVCSNTQAPFPMIFSEFIAVSSLACQGVIGVRRPNGPELPCSMWVLSIAESGERKTSVASLITKPIQEVQAEYAKKYEHELPDYAVNRLAWDVEQKAILEAISKKAKKGDASDDLKKALRAHKLSEPKKPRHLKFIYEDATPEAIQFGLHENGLSAGIFSDEAGSIFDGQALRDFAMINTLWSGGSLTVDRRSSPSYVLQDARLTMSLMVQPSIMRKFFDRRGEEARGIGLLSRFLIAQPQSTQGTRYIDNRPQSWENLDIFHNRIKEILEQSIADKNGVAPSRRVLEFSSEAAAHWRDAYNAIESEMNPGMDLFDVKDYAAKIAENIARMAALFHVIEGGQGDITLEAVSRANTVCKWYADEFKRLFAPAHQMPPEQIYANELEHWFVKIIQSHRQARYKKNDIRQFGPNSLRNKIRLDAAIECLAFQNKIFIHRIGKATFIDLHVNYFSQLANVFPSQLIL